MADALRRDEFYVLRIQWPGNRPEFGHEFAGLIREVADQGPVFKICYAWQPKQEVQIAEFPFSHDGFVVTSMGGDPYEGCPVAEMGYFLGSTDPWDLALAEMNQKLSRPAVTAVT